MQRGYTIYPQPIRPPVCSELPYRSRLLVNADGDTADLSMDWPEQRMADPDDATVDVNPPTVSSPIARIPAWVMFLVTSALLVVVTLVGGALIGGAVWLVRWIAR